MKTQTKYNMITLGTGLAFLGSVFAGRTMLSQHRKIEQLEQELGRAEQKIETTELARDNYRKQLIEHGNPEGWQLTGDSLTGVIYYTRENGDTIGSYWTEYLY